MGALSLPCRYRFTQRRNRRIRRKISAILSAIAATESTGDGRGSDRQRWEADGDPAGFINTRIDFDRRRTLPPTCGTMVEGRGACFLKLPHNLTRYRVMVCRGGSGGKLRHGRTNLTARLPLMVRPPRRASSTLAINSNCPLFCKTRPTCR